MLAFSIFLALFAFSRASDVLEFTDSDFEDKVAEHDIILVEFFAPWCGHCKRLAPEYEKAATELMDADPPVSLAKVDCTAETKTCSKYGVSGYPTLKIFKNGEFSDEYNGPRDSDGIVKYMKSKAGPSSKKLETLEDAQKFLSKEDEHGIIGFFSSEDSDLAKQFQKLADSLSEDFRFAHTYSKDVADSYKYKDAVVIFQPSKLQNKFDEKEKKYDGEANNKKMKDWVMDNIHGFAGVRKASNQDQFKKPLVVVYYDVDYVKNAKGTNYVRNRVMKVAKKLKDAGKTLYFAISNADDFSYELSEYGLSKGDKPLVAARNNKDEKFIMADEYSVDNLEKFANDFIDGKVEPYLKSEPVPEDNDGPVKVVVAKNFNEIVNDESKDVLIEFYAPWCGHCKSLAPKYDELGEKLKGESSITIAKMDATANDVPKQYQVSGFPTLYFAPRGSKSSPKRYEGGREVKDFLQYIAREATDELSGYNRDGKKRKAKKDKVEL